MDRRALWGNRSAQAEEAQDDQDDDDEADDIDDAVHGVLLKFPEGPNAGERLLFRLGPHLSLPTRPVRLRLAA